MLLRMRLLDIALCHLLHHEISINLNLFDQLTLRNPPLGRNSQGTNGWLGVDERVDAVGDVGESELVGCLMGRVSDFGKVE